MRNSKKKSPAKSKKKSKKNPLKKYVGGGPTLGSSGFTPTYSTGPTVGSFYGNTTGFTPTTGTTFGGGTTFGSNNTFGSGTLGNNTYGFNTGSATGNNNYGFTPVDFNQVNADLGFNPSNSAYSGTDRTLDSTITPEKKFDGKQEAREKIKEMGYGEYLDKKPEPKQMTKGEITSTALGAVPGTVGAIANLASSSKIDDPSNYYDKKTRAELERYNKKIKASSAASSVGSGLMATSAAWGPLAWIPAAAGAITMAASEGAKASYQAKQGNLGKSYDERVADRMAYKQRQADKKQQNLDRYSNMNYYGAGSGLSRDGGLPKMKSGGPMYMEKYGVGGLSRVHGPTHEQGGIPIAFNSDPQDGGPQIVPKESGMAEGELEDNEMIDQTDITQEILREGGVKSGTYMFSEHVGVDGKKGKNKKSLSYADARGKVEKMNLPRDMKKNVIRDLMNNQAEDTNKPERFGNGDMMKYQKGGNRKEVLSSDISKVLQNDTLNPDFIRRPLSIDESKVWQDDDLSPDFINKEKQAKVYKENSIPEKKNGGLMKYQNAGLKADPSYGDLMKGDTGKYTEAQTSNAVNSLYNRRKPVENKRTFEDHSESEQQLIELVSGSSTKPKYTPYVPQYQNLQNQSYRRNGVDVTQRTPNYANSNMSSTINYTDATGKERTVNNPYANFKSSWGNPAQLYNDPFADKNLHPVPKNVEFTRRDSLLGIRDRNLPLSAEEIESLGAEADRNYRVPVNIPPSWGPVSDFKLRYEEGKLPRFGNAYDTANTPKNRNGGLPKYQSGSYTVQSGDTLSGIAQAQGIADYNEIYNLNKALIGADPGRIQPGQVLTMPGAASTSTPAATSAWSSAPMPYTAGTGPLGASPLSGYPGFGAGTLTGSGKRPAKPPVKDKSTGEFNKYAPYGIAALGAAGQIATIAAMNAKEGVDPVNVASISPPDQIYLPSVKDPTKGGRESDRRAMLRDINTGTGPGKAGRYQQARIGLMREEEKMALGIEKMNADIRQAEAFKNAERKDTTAYKNAEIVYKNAVSARNEALRLLESKNNKLKAYGDVARGVAKDTLEYYAMEEQAKAAAGDTGVMNRFYANNYEKFAKKYQKENPGASAHDTYVAFTSEV